MMTKPLRLVLFLGLILAPCASAQVAPDMATGLSPYATYIPGDIDNVNPVNGNVFIKIPLLQYPQRGDRLRLNYYIFYNDKQWQANLALVTAPSGSQSVSGYWAPAGVSAPGTSSSYQVAPGVYVGRDQFAGILDNVTTGTVVTTTGLGADAVVESSTYMTRAVYSSDGSIHYIGDGINESVACGQMVGGGSCPSVPSWGNGSFINTYPATDASGWSQFGYDPEGIAYSPNSVTDPNGNSITASSSGWKGTLVDTIIPGSSSGLGSNEFPKASGGYISPGYFDLTPGMALPTVPSECPQGTTSTARSWTVPASVSYGGSATYYLCYTYISYQTAFNLNNSLIGKNYFFNNVPEASSSSSPGPGQALLLTAVVLPDLNMYTFQYDQYLSLINIGLPTGGSIAYTWQNIVFRPTPYVSSSWAGISTPISRALATRTVTPGDGQPAITTSYTWNISASPNCTTSSCAQGVSFPAYSIITDSNGNDTEYTLGGTDEYGTMWNDYITTAVAYYSGCSPHHSNCSPGTGTSLKSLIYGLTAVTSGGAPQTSPAYVPLPPTFPPTRVTQTTTHLPTASGDKLSRVVQTLTQPYGSCTVYVYPAYLLAPPNQFSSITQNNCYTSGQIASTATYDFGSPGSGTPGSLLKTETFVYAWQSSSSVLTANMLDLIASDTITDGSGNWIAETDKCYDANGNNTSAQKFPTKPSSHSCSTPPANALITSSTYSNGVVTSTKNARGNTTSMSSFTCNSSLPKTVTHPDQYQMTYQYDCNIGKVTSVQDSNDSAGNVSTTYTYNDPLGRVSAANYPDGGSASVIYSDVGSPNTFPITMQVTTATGEAAGPKTATTTYDGLGRATKSQVQVNSSGSVAVTNQTNYDNMGRVLAVSNPYYGTSDSTFGWTVNAYDALGRMRYRCNPDNGTSSSSCSSGTSYQQWSYNGNVVTWTNENSKPWQRTSDALGRLTQVVEPGTLSTHYSYDGLGNLTCVAQAGTSTSQFTGCSTALTSWLLRSFTYDGVSRLQTSLNPETGTICYGTWSGSTCSGGYDGNGNLISKTDARGIVTSYSYDTMNRLLSKSYTSDSSGTPISCYQYDTSQISGVPSAGANLIEHLTNAWTQPAGIPCKGTYPNYAPVAGSYISLKSILAYDAMGRPTSAQQQQCVNGTCSAASPYSLTLAYDLIGNVTSLTNSVGADGSPLTLTNYFDAVARPCLTTSSWTLPNSSNNPTAPANLFEANPSISGANIGYAPQGGLQNWYLGSSSATASSACGTTPSSLVNLQQSFSPRLWVKSFTATGQVP